MSHIINNISNRLSLRTPQKKSLEILHRIMEIAGPHKTLDLKTTLSMIQSEFSTVEDFERMFPNLCFSLATGVGKTRLMGAFIAYLHLEYGIRHFFVLAPNLTIYKKLVADFTPNNPKYVFQGIAEFSVKSPTLITGDNFEQRPQTLDLFERDDVVINIFNISKFNVRSADSRKIHRLSEFLGQSYFNYLSELDDLVLIMDEAHRYRADASMKSIEELNPVLGLELTATPQIESSSKPIRFKNIIYDYPLKNAMRDGYVKEPAAGTRRNFSSSAMSQAALDLLKLEDGIRVHESTKVELDIFAQQNNLRRVKPFMLVIASDTQHADALVKLIEDKQFFDGRYKGRVIQVHSSQKGAEKDENVERLLAVENPDEPTEIVVHVNMLKEGWDVTNLYTIVPLRTADSRTLVEQSIGRGLRLPYGKRTGVPAVDRLTIIAHDRFQDIIDEAKKGGFTFSIVNIGEDIPEIPNQAVVVAPTVEAALGLSQPVLASQFGEQINVKNIEGSPVEEPKLKSPEEVAATKMALDAIRKLILDPKVVPGSTALQTENVQKQLVQEVKDTMNSGQLLLYPNILEKDLANIVCETTAVYLAHTIAIPRIIVLPKGIVRNGFKEFNLDLSSLRLQPVSQEIIIQHLASDTCEIIGALEGGHEEERFEDYVVRGLIDFDDVSYDEQADLLYGLAEQVVNHIKGYLQDENDVRNVLQFHQRQIANLVHAQMQHHAWQEASSYETIVSHGFSEVHSQAFAASASETIRQFDIPIENKLDIRKMMFGGFKRCLYPVQKFDTDTERRFAVILEKDEKVIKWFKPGKGVFQIRYTTDSDYEPDFVVETETEKLICEPKRADQMKDQTVLAKAKAAATWCKHATDYEIQHSGKPWRYLLIPHDAIADNMTIEGLARNNTFSLPTDA